jgi:uncharacterized membrane protein (UPF0127 family)
MVHPVHRVRPLRAAALLLTAAALLASGCGSDETGCCGSDLERNDLANMQTARMTVGGQEVEVWLALTSQERALGLMHVEAHELAPTNDGALRGMLFVYDSERLLSFWMKDTPTALDIAFIRADGTIARIHTMTPFDTSTYGSGQPAQYALEVLAGTFAGLGVTAGDQVVLPPGI